MGSGCILKTTSGSSTNGRCTGAGGSDGATGVSGTMGGGGSGSVTFFFFVSIFFNEAATFSLCGHKDFMLHKVKS